jgi:hypothetical protein
MHTVFSHIVQKRLSKESENVATEALAFILESSEAAKGGMMKLLRGIVPDLPDLWFRPQQTEGNSRPDMWGRDEGGSAHVFVENKFWAGLTDSQPVSYLKVLGGRPHSSLLLVVVPAARERTVWTELNKRLKDSQISADTRPVTPGSNFVVKTGAGPIMALTTWTTLLAFLNAETVEDLCARNDIAQIKALCDQADSDAFLPFLREQMSDQQTPSLLLQLTGLIQEVSDLAFHKGVLVKGNLRPQSGAKRIGRYASIPSEEQCGVWLGIHLKLWKDYGQSPFWMVFSKSDWGRAHEVRALLEPWAAQKNVFVAPQPEGSFAVAIDIPCGEEKESLVQRIVDQFEEIGRALRPLPPRKSKAEPDLKEE